MVGLPAAGKTTRAKEIEEARHALRLTPDEWMILFFGEPEGGKPEFWRAASSGWQPVRSAAGPV